MSQSRLSPKLVAGIIVALFFGVALYLRIVLPYDQVFSGDWIKFTGVDAYHFMRQVDNLVHNFPHLMSFDPYMRYPHGSQLSGLNFFVYLLSGVIWLVGLGSPTQHTIDIVGVYFPAIVGAFTVIPVYFIGKALLNRGAGVIAAGLIAIYPGVSMGHSILGFADRDTVQVLFTTVTMLFLILAVKTASQRQLTFNHLKRWDSAVITKPLICSLLAGIFLGIYLLTWKGAFIFVFIIFVYLVIQYIIDHLRHKSTDYLCFVGTITFFVALIMFLSTSPSRLYLVSLVIALVTPLVLAGVSWLMVRKRIKPSYYPLALVGLGMAGLVILYIVNPSFLNTVQRSFGLIFAQSAVRLTTTESRPILFPHGNFSLSAVWGSFTTSFFLSFISLGILIYFTIKNNEADKTLFIVWSLIIFVFTLAMHRLALFFAVNAALLTGYLSWLILKFTGFKETAAKPLEAPKKAEKKVKQKKTQKGGFRLTNSHIYMAVGIVVVCFLSFFPNIGPAVVVASQARFAPSEAWIESLSWLKDNTPDPFGSPDFYYDLYETPFHYPETAYGVVALWDYGYWIIRIGHRLPNCDPGAGTSVRARVGRFFTAQDEASASKIVSKLSARYVIVDGKTAISAFPAVATYAGRSTEEFGGDFYYQVQEGKFMTGRLLYPEYYRSLAVRLYNFDGVEVTPESSTVISYEEKRKPDGETYKEIASLQSFPNYEEAEAYVLSQGSEHYKIVSDNPLVSPVPLEALEHYKLVYRSDKMIHQYGGRIPEVKIFEYIGD